MRAGLMGKESRQSSSGRTCAPLENERQHAVAEFGSSGWHSGTEREPVRQWTCSQIRLRLPCDVVLGAGKVDGLLPGCTADLRPIAGPRMGPPETWLTMANS